jgi:outer membrane usher protein
MAMARSSSPARRTKLWLRPLLLLIAPGAAQAAELASAPQPMLLEVTLNGQSMGEPWLVLRDPAGGTWIAAALLGKSGLRIGGCESANFEGESYCRVDKLPAMTLTASDAEQRLALQAEPGLFERQTASLAPPAAGEMSDPGTGAFLNYELLAETARGKLRAGGAFEAGLYTPHGVGIATFVADVGGGATRLTRLETNWTHDDPENLTSIRIGDSVTRAGPHAAPIRFAGIQYGRNFAVRPAFITMPLPSVEGSAAMPSVVDIYVNNSLRGSRTVTPGPFELTDVPVRSGGGTVDVVTRDLLGREVVTSLSYYAGADMLQRGLHDFSYELGFERRGFGYKSHSYGALSASTTHRFGLTDHVTIEGHVQASRSRQAASGAVTAAWPGIGLVSVSAAGSRGRHGIGGALGAAFERRTEGLSLGLRSELTTARYTYAGLPAGYEIPRLTVQGFADLPVKRMTVGVNVLHRDFRYKPEETLLGAFATLPLGRLGSLQLYARRTALGQSETSFGGHFVLPLGGRRSASASYEHRRRGSLASATFQSDPPVGNGSGFRVAATTGAVDSARAEYRLQTQYAAFGAEVAYAEGGAGVRLSAAGAVGTIAGDSFASRRLGDSFAAVEVKGHKGVRVYADNQLIGRTGADGRLVLPALRAFDDNRIRIDETDLPMDVQLARNEASVRPFARSGAVIRFDAKRERGVLLRVALADGSFLPAGAEVGVEESDERLVVATHGEIYVPDMAGTRRFRARIGAKSCTFEATAPDNDDPQPLIDGLICVEAPQYVAR